MEFLLLYLLEGRPVKIKVSLLVGVRLNGMSGCSKMGKLILFIREFLRLLTLELVTRSVTKELLAVICFESYFLFFCIGVLYVVGK